MKTMNKVIAAMMMMAITTMPAMAGNGEILNERITLKIAAENPFFPPNTTVCADVFAEHGRGLFLVDKLCEERSFTPDGEMIIVIKTK